MLQGYIILYTGEGGFGQFIDSGICQAKIKPEPSWDFQIIVPIQAVTYETDENDEGNMKKEVHVDIPRANAR